MRNYDEMTKDKTEPDGIPGNYFRCCKRCPKCKRDLFTNGTNDYMCVCGYESIKYNRSRRSRAINLEMVNPETNELVKSFRSAKQAALHICTLCDDKDNCIVSQNSCMLSISSKITYARLSGLVRYGYLWREAK